MPVLCENLRADLMRVELRVPNGGPFTFRHLWQRHLKNPVVLPARRKEIVELGSSNALFKVCHFAFELE